MTCGAIEGAVHRTFNAEDFIYFIEALKYVYREKGGMESIFALIRPVILFSRPFMNSEGSFLNCHTTQGREAYFRSVQRISGKKDQYVPRWMIRRDNRGVDFGLWNSISPSMLSCPLDVHSGNVARKLGLLTRKQNDSKAVAELDGVLGSIDPEDPARYDFALFGLGAIEKF